MKKELRFGLALMAVILIYVALTTPWGNMTSGHYGLLMLSLVVVAIMLGFPTAFTLMGMGVLFAWIAYGGTGSATALRHTLDLTVQRTYGVMTNEVLIAIPLFVFMGYLVERANLIEKLFRSLHLARVPGSLAVATLVTCAIFATATGIIGAVVTLMGLLALPAMLRAGYDAKLSAGAITAGGCLGILIPPSVMLIVYGATAGVSVVKLYAGAFFPGLMLAFLYIVYVVIVAKIKPELAPPLPESERAVAVPSYNAAIEAAHGRLVLPALFRALRSGRRSGTSARLVAGELLTTLLPALTFCLIMGLVWHALTKSNAETDLSGLQEMGMVGSPQAAGSGVSLLQALGVQEPPSAPGIQEPPGAPSIQEPPMAAGVKEPPGGTLAGPPTQQTGRAAPQRLPTPTAFWILLAIGTGAVALIYGWMTFPRLEIFRMLLGSFFPLAVMILAVLGTIVFGLATPTEAAAIGAPGGFILATVYFLLAKPSATQRRVLRLWIPLWLVFGASILWFALYKLAVLASGPPPWLGILSMSAFSVWGLLAVAQMNLLPTLRESAFLTARTSAMVCWLFVGSSIFSAAFALLGGQEVIETWVLSLDLTPTQFLLLSQVIIFILGWPLEWTEIIVIFMPIFIPLLEHYNIDPLFFGLLVALNLQTAFLSPPVAMAAFYLKGVAPPHVTLNQIFAGMMPFMVIQVIAMALLYLWPQIGLWLPTVIYQ